MSDEVKCAQPRCTVLPCSVALRAACAVGRELRDEDIEAYIRSGGDDPTLEPMERGVHR